MTRVWGKRMRPHKHTAQTQGHVPAHKTRVWHDPASRLEKDNDRLS